MLKIKLARVGRRNDPKFRVIIQEDSRSPKSRALEILGWLDRVNKKYSLNKERIKFWLEKGAQATDSVYNLLISDGIIQGKKIDVSKKATLRKKKEVNQELPTSS